MDQFATNPLGITSPWLLPTMDASIAMIPKSGIIPIMPLSIIKMDKAIDKTFNKAH